ncbi:hypothetical protein KCP73_17730 [Salmonella enterica subsp. enterica]|nr:hypothetical protein KCP73_17730 [Salmonella enterica subsp. enterica]
MSYAEPEVRFKRRWTPDGMVCPEHDLRHKLSLFLYMIDGIHREEAAAPGKCF